LVLPDNVGMFNSSYALMLLAIFIVLWQTSGQAERNAPSTPFGMTEVIEKHAEWLESNGTRGARADLREISLEGTVNRATGDALLGGMVLRGVDLRQADFRAALMRNIDLSGANLQDTRFDQANLRWAILSNADLRRANFTGANLQEVDLRAANLAQAVFNKADLSGADLTGARCVTMLQLLGAITDGRTKLPTFEDCAPQIR
jgi:uncharacterized protein YjbI with pentapeptide repeats